MAHGRESLGHEFEVDSIDYTTSIDVFINILKRRETILYKGSGFINAANIAYVSGEEITSENNLSIADRSTSLAANRTSAIGITTISAAKSFRINTDQFIVTDVYTDTSNSIFQIPLFSQHILDPTKVTRVSDDDLTLDENVRLVTVHILDYAMQVVNVSEMLIDYDQGIIYNNLSPSFNSSTDFTAYYIRYTIEDNGVTYSYTDLLDNTNVYQVASFDDLDEAIAILPGRKVYLLTELGTEYEVILPEEGTYSYRSTQAARVQLIAPAVAEDSDTWYVRISNGDFLSIISNVTYRYHIAEFLNQSFSPTAPYKRSILEESTILNANLIKLDRGKIVEDDDLDLYVSIIIEDANGDGVASFTTDPLLEGVTATNGVEFVIWNSTDQLGIRSIDHRTGYIDIDGVDLKDSWKVTATYNFEEDSYEFTTKDFNPITHPERLRERIAFFIDTDAVEAFRSKTVYYMVIDESGKVIESDWWDFNNTTGLHNDGDEVYYESKPAWKPSGDHHLFISEETVEGSGTLLALGEVTVAAGQDIEESIMMDTRVRGGGIREDSLEEALSLQPEVDWYWDIANWDGIPYPGTASFLVEFPVTILDGAGGSFSPSEVRDIIERHVAAGVYPIIRAYGINVEISGIHMVESGIQVDWNGFGY